MKALRKECLETLVAEYHGRIVKLMGDNLEAYLDEYVRTAGIGEDKKGPLFRAARAKNGGLSERPLDRRNALELIYRRAKQAGIATQIGCHTFRATGITIHLTNGGTLEKAR